MSIADNLARLAIKKATGIGKCCENCGSIENLETVVIGSFVGPKFKLLCSTCAMLEKTIDVGKTY